MIKDRWSQAPELYKSWIHFRIWKHNVDLKSTYDTDDFTESGISYLHDVNCCVSSGETDVSMLGEAHITAT
jgi:hypothetical protein